MTNYNQGNDEWLLRKVRDEGVEIAKRDFSADECMRVLWLAASGEIHLNRNDVANLEKRIRYLRNEQIRIAREAANNKI